LSPFSLYENRVGGSITGDNYAINLFFNDNVGTRTLGNSITTRIDGATVAGPGIVGNSINIGADLKVQSNNRVLISPISLTAAAVAQFEVRGQAGVSPNTTFLSRSAGNTASQIVMWAQNLAGNSLFYIDATAKHFHNVSQLSTGDFNMRGLTDVNLFYADASTDRVGIGIAALTSKLTVNGDIETLTNTKGIIVLDRTNATRYRIYTDGGVLNTEAA
jgi:hypothetical protein